MSLRFHRPLNPLPGVRGRSVRDYAQQGDDNTDAAIAGILISLVLVALVIILANLR